MTTQPTSGSSSISHSHLTDEHRVRGGYTTGVPAGTGVAGQWGAIVAGAFSGLAAAVVMATLGAALGFTGVAVAAGSADAANMTAEGAMSVAAGSGIGAGIWLLITALVVGLVGGGVLAKMSRVDRTYAPPVLAVVTWSVGLAMAVLLAAIAGGGALATGIGAGVGAAGVAATGVSSSMTFDPRTNRDAEMGSGSTGVAAEASAVRSAPAISDRDRAMARDAAETASTVAATAIWFALIAQLLGLGATIFAATRVKEHVAMAR